VVFLIHYNSPKAAFRLPYSPGKPAMSTLP
jgi:hypothetical protein